MLHLPKNKVIDCLGFGLPPNLNVLCNSSHSNGVSGQTNSLSTHETAPHAYHWFIATFVSVASLVWTRVDLCLRASM